LVECVQTEPSVGKGLWTHMTQQDVAYRYKTHRTHRMQSPGWESQDATLLDLTQATFLLMQFNNLYSSTEGVSNSALSYKPGERFKYMHPE